MMKKFSAVTIVATALLTMAGCASQRESNVPPMPIDENPSIALKFARSMNLRLITDSPNGQYVVFNQLVGTLVKPLNEPVLAGEKGSIQKSGHGLADVAFGVVGNMALIPTLSVLTSKSPVAYSDGLPRITSWNAKSVDDERVTIAEKLKKVVPLMEGFPGNELCQGNYYWGNYITRMVGKNNQITDFDQSQVPTPPLVNVQGKTKPFNYGSCLFVLVGKASNQDKLKQLSADLGAERAVFIPGSHENKPVVYYNGTAYFFEK